MAPESERACTKCGHPRNAHDMEQPYQCFHIPDGAFEYSCDCDGFSHAPEPTLTCSDCGHPKDDSRYHLDAPGTNWGAALHWYVAPSCSLNESNRTQFESGCSEVVERLAAIADECYHGPYDHGCPHGREIARDIRTQATAILHSWRERRVQELERELLYVRGLLWKLRNTAKSALTDAKSETDEWLARENE